MSEEESASRKQGQKNNQHQENVRRNQPNEKTSFSLNGGRLSPLHISTYARPIISDDPFKGKINPRFGPREIFRPDTQKLRSKSFQIIQFR